MNKINILSPGRFHVCDLARELDRNGFDVKFYSFVPTKRAEKFGLPRHCSASLIAWLSPFLALEKVIFKRQKWAKRLRIKAQDVLTGLIMRRCDVCISMSGDFVFAPKVAKRKGAKIIIERGSKHILEQRRVLESIPTLAGKKPVPDINVKRELECYKLADYIAIASKHVKESFQKQHFDESKLFVNPYGVDLTDFYPIKEAKKEYDVIMVGGWSYRKGCDLIVDAIKQTSYKFLHVGSIVDMQFPQNDSQFTHIDAVNQKELVKYYNKAKVFVLPSREEGLAMVQAQAVACNLPLVGSYDSGAEDLKVRIKNPEYITLITEYSAEAVRNALDEAMNNYNHMTTDNYAGNMADSLSWKAYGDRYSEFINKIARK